MAPLGWETAAKLVAGMPPTLSESEWEALVEGSPPANEGMRSGHMSRKQFDTCLDLLKEGCVAVNPMLLLRNNDASFGLSGVNCAYVRAATTAEATAKTIERLLAKGVRAFSIYVCSLSSPISALFAKLEELAKNAPKRGPVPVFAIWMELHSKRLLEYIAEVSDPDALRFTSKQHPSALLSPRTPKENKSSRATLGVFVPKLFFELLAQQKFWHFHEGVASTQLSTAHGHAYCRKYDQLRDRAEGACAMRAHRVLSLLVRASLSNHAKFVMLLRDSCHSLRASASGASTIWNETVQDAPIFPNHMAEVPLVCPADVTLQFAAFVNVERTRSLGRDDAVSCQAAYTFLDSMLRSHVSAAQDHAQEGEVLALSSAVGIIGVHDSLPLCECTDLKRASASRDFAYSRKKPHPRSTAHLREANDRSGRRWSKGQERKQDASISQVSESKRGFSRSLSLPPRHNGHSQVKEEAVEGESWGVEVIGASVSSSVPRPVSAADIERLVVPLVRSGHAVFPMSGTLASILWRVSPGAWTCQQPYWIYATASDEAVVVPSGSFARFCAENAVSFDHLDSVNAAAEKYAARLSAALHGRILSSRVEAQIHELRKLCSSFFSTTSMPLTLSHEDSHEFSSASALLLFLAEVVIKNANNDCSVLLPEIRTSVTDASLAEFRRKTCAVPGAMRKLWTTCIKRRRTGEVSSAVDELEKFFDEVVDKLRELRTSAQKPLSLYALQVFQTLVSQKLEEV